MIFTPEEKEWLASIINQLSIKLSDPTAPAVVGHAQAILAKLAMTETTGTKK